MSEKRTLGKTGFEVSTVGVGCWQLGGCWTSSDDTAAHKLALHAYLDAGANLLDTANVYGGDPGTPTFGWSEKTIGEVLQERKAAGNTDRVYVCTKAGRAPTVKAIVGKVDLAAPDAAQKLDALVKTSDLVKGVRYIIDYDGPWGEDNGTHPEVSRHGKDYLRGPEASDFERGFALLAKHGLSYDLQCAPAQLPAAAALLARPPVF